MNAYKSHIVRSLLMALLVLSATTSCYDYGKETETVLGLASVNYIKLDISVQASNTITRGDTKPEGDEDGDGYEPGFVDRENKVDGVTLILYRADDAGINAAGNTQIDFVRYFETTLVSNTDKNPGTVSTERFDEAVYTTGEKQLYASEGILLNAKYHAIIIANTNLAGTFHKGSTLAEVRDFLISGNMLYTGSGKTTDARKFMMSSEADFTMDFSNVTPTDYNEGKLYSFNKIYIERLAARVDFWADGSNGYKTKDKNNVDYTEPGYEYNVGETTDRFVLTRVVPFNVSKGSEYLIKRTDNATAPYLANETGTNWVVDPQTSAKGVAQYLSNVESTLASVVSAENFSTLPYGVTMASQQSNSNTGKYTISGADNMIVGYTSENTLNATSLLYYNATGLAFEGYYYVDGDATRGERCVYYHYLRHQGESDEPYQALQASELSTEATCGSETPMKYGIVRNNLYRVSVSGINSKTNLTIKIKVKKWDPFTHEVIYM
jgi:hypothetical protein